MTQYKDKTGEGTFVSGTKWESYNQVEVDDGTIEVGDIMTFEDPDIGYHYDGEFTNELFVGKITKIMDIHGRDNPEFITTIPVGRLELDTCTSVSGERFDNVEKWNRKFINQFLTSNFENWFSIKWRASDGTPEIDGE